MSKKSSIHKAKSPGKQKKMLAIKRGFHIPALFVVVLGLIIMGYVVTKIFAASPSDNPYDCSPPYNTIQKGVSDSSYGRRDHCVSAVQWAIGNLAPANWTIFRPPYVDGVFEQNDAGTETAIDNWQYYNGYAGYPQRGSSLPPDQLVKMAAQWPFKPYVAPTPQPTPPPQPPPQPSPPPPPVVIVSPDPTFGSGGVSDLPQLNEVTQDELSGASDSQIDTIIDNSLNGGSTSNLGSSTNTSQRILRTYSGKLKLLPPHEALDEGATQIRYYIDGKLKNAAKKSPFAYVLDTTRLANKRHVLTVVSYSGSDKLTENSYLLSIKNNLNFWQKLYNILTAPFA